jgi:ATP-binding cassette subfamily F protein uup
MARDSNVLVLDEPTNDLDIETLDLLQDILGEYDGTVLLVSHDRDFLDRVATTTIAMEGDGRATVYAGGWSDYRTQRGEIEMEVAAAKALAPKEKPKAATTQKSGLSFTEKHRFETLPQLIDKLTAEIGKLEVLLSDPELFRREPAKFKKATEAMAERQASLAAAEEEWLILAERAEA